MRVTIIRDEAAEANGPFPQILLLSITEDVHEHELSTQAQSFAFFITLKQHQLFHQHGSKKRREQWWRLWQWIRRWIQWLPWLLIWQQVHLYWTGGSHRILRRLRFVLVLLFMCHIFSLLFEKKGYTEEADGTIIFGSLVVPGAVRCARSLK